MLHILEIRDLPLLIRELLAAYVGNKPHGFIKAELSIFSLNRCAGKVIIPCTVSQYLINLYIINKSSATVQKTEQGFQHYDWP